MCTLVDEALTRNFLKGCKGYFFVYKKVNKRIEEGYYGPMFRSFVWPKKGFVEAESIATLPFFHYPEGANVPAEVDKGLHGFLYLHNLRHRWLGCKTILKIRVHVDSVLGIEKLTGEIAFEWGEVICEVPAP